MVMKIKYCRAYVENTKARCTKEAIWGTNYCWSHYPKREPFFSAIIGGIVGILLSLFLQDPLVQFFSKCSIFHWMDKNLPVIEKIIPEIDKSSIVDRSTTQFEILYSDKDSGLNFSKSYLKISYKDNQEYKSLVGELGKANSKLYFNLDKELKYGEYFFEVLLIDKANNKTEFRKAFIVKEVEDLGFTVRYYKYEDCRDKEIFVPFLEGHRDLVNAHELYVYYLNVHNKASKVQLRDLYFTVDTPGVIFDWKEVGSVDVKGVKAYKLQDVLEPHRKLGSRVYVGQQFVNIDNLGPHGFYAVAILVGKIQLMPDVEKINIWEGIQIYGTYILEGYGSSEIKKIKFELPISKITSKNK